MASFGDVMLIAVPAGAFIAYLTDCLGMCPGLRTKINDAIGGIVNPNPQSAATFETSYAAFPVDAVFQPIPSFSSAGTNLRHRDFVRL